MLWAIDATAPALRAVDMLEQIIQREKPDAILPTMGGQTGLNLAKALAEAGKLKQYGVELIGAKLDSINVAEDRLLFKNAMAEIGLKCPPSGTANTLEEAIQVATVRGVARQRAMLYQRRLALPGHVWVPPFLQVRGVTYSYTPSVSAWRPGADRQLPHHHPPGLHARRHGRRHRLQHGRVQGDRQARHRRVHDQPGPRGEEPGET